MVNRKGWRVQESFIRWSADPEIGKGFISAAARILRRGGQLWMVANRQLPYESRLKEHFVDFKEIAGDSRFKVLNAKGPIT